MERIGIDTLHRLFFGRSSKGRLREQGLCDSLFCFGEGAV